ncbi:MAG: helix-turn-helix domain-containing protein [Lachnospiraceae bacterium]|nr:helix-turn-helix domain-containing protein [Lachnospiraceae bacterium]
MSYSYNELYLPLAQRVLGDMYDFAVHSLKYSISEFHKMFIASGMAAQFEIANPTYVAGKNGCEVAKEVVEDCGLERPDVMDIMYVDKSMEYWIGWSLAYYQWTTGYSFHDIERCVPIEELYNMYPVYHESDLSLFIETMNERTAAYMSESRLRRLRAYANMTQKQLAEFSGVPLRQIQLFEQGQRDINKTQGDTLEKLAGALRCEIKDLLQ